MIQLLDIVCSSFILNCWHSNSMQFVRCLQNNFNEMYFVLYSFSCPECHRKHYTDVCSVQLMPSQKIQDYLAKTVKPIHLKENSTFIFSNSSTESQHSLSVTVPTAQHVTVNNERTTKGSPSSPLLCRTVCQYNAVSFIHNTFWGQHHFLSFRH